MAWSVRSTAGLYGLLGVHDAGVEYDRYGQQNHRHREEGISTYRAVYNPRGQLVSQKDAQGREIRYEYGAGKYDSNGITGR